MNYFKIPDDIQKLIEMDLRERSHGIADMLLQIYNENIPDAKIDAIN